jgi:hypothetical protein
MYRRLPILLAALGLACGNEVPLPPDPPGSLDLTRTWRSDDVPGCAMASPILVSSQGQDLLLTAYSDGVVIASSPDDGREVFRVALAAPAGQEAHIAATPGVLGSRVVLAYMLRDTGGGTRRSHQIAVLDLETRALDPRFPAVTLAASVAAADRAGTVEFLAANAYSRATVKTTHPADMTYGLAYVSFGNLRDVQPWHGWLFELDLDAWAQGGAAISSVLLDTPERDCGPNGQSGSLDMRCGGGIWTPAGPTLVEHAGGFEIFVPTGNGQLDLGRRDYANSVLRTGRGLHFAPGCDPTACADFDPVDPAPACMQSCSDLFIPRLLPGDAPFAPPDQLCEGKTFLECYARLDWDLGANAPVRVAVPGGDDVLVIPGKDGGVYLVDAENLGTLHDRIQVAEICGSHGGTCTANWAGTMVTVPAVTQVAGVPTVIVPTFEFDHTNPAGLVALSIVRDAGGTPRWHKLWEAPPFSSAEAIERFREHMGRIALLTVAGVEYAAAIDPGGEHSTDGVLYLVRVADGAIVERAPLDGPGRKYTLPAVRGGTLYVASCDAEVGPSHLEAWSAAAQAH